MPKIEHKPDAASHARQQFTREHFQQIFQKLAQASNGKILNTGAGNYWDHPAGGCRMGTDPTSECLRQLRANARSRESLRGRLANAAECRMHQRHPDLCGADSPLGGTDRRQVPEDSMRLDTIAALLCSLALAQEWPNYGGDAAETHYSRLALINRENVRNLKPAWEWKTGEAPMPDFKTNPGNFEVTPLMIGGVLYLSTPYNRVVALDAATGRDDGRTIRKLMPTGRSPTARASSIAAWRRGATPRPASCASS